MQIDTDAEFRLSSLTPNFCGSTDHQDGTNESLSESVRNKEPCLLDRIWAAG